MSEEIMADIQRSLGRIENKVDTALAWQRSHVEDDRAQFEGMRKEIRIVQMQQAAQRGRARVWGLVATALGTAAGAIAGIWHRG